MKSTGDGFFYYFSKFHELYIIVILYFEIAQREDLCLGSDRQIKTKKEFVKNKVIFMSFVSTNTIASIL